MPVRGYGNRTAAFSRIIEKRSGEMCPGHTHKVKCPGKTAGKGRKEVVTKKMIARVPEGGQ
jgi:hypothetical protein